MEINLVAEGLKFMVLGMIVVFAFLAVLVQLMKIQAKLIEKYFPEKEAVAVKPRAPSTNESARTAAMIAAITEFTKNKSQTKA